MAVVEAVGAATASFARQVMGKTSMAVMASALKTHGTPLK
jgi:hypothetical protein